MIHPKIITATIEARMTSSRLPGKVMLKAGNKPMLQILVERLKRSKYLNEIIVATTINQDDDIIVDFCRNFNTKYYRGSEHNVLERVCDAAKSAETDVLVEITGDDVLIDPVILDQAIEIFLDKYPKCRYVSNTGTLPWGLDFKIFKAEDLYKINDNNPDELDKEHVSYSFYRSDKQNTYSPYYIKYESELNRPELRITMDYYEDYVLIKSIYEELSHDNPNFSAADIIKWLDKHPGIRDLSIIIREEKNINTLLN